MASDFIGYTILVTLQHPPNAQIQGVVADVVNQKLHLQNVLLLWTGQRLATYMLDAGDIADVEVSSSQAPSHLPTPTTAAHHLRHIPAQSQFVDPAILSYSKPLNKPLVPSSIQPVSPIMIADGVVTSPFANLDRRPATKQSSISSIGTTQPIRERRDSQATAVLTEPFDHMALKDGMNDKKRTKKHKSSPSQTAPGIIDIKDINGPLKPPKKPAKGKGWRQTPLIQDLPNPTKQRGRKFQDDPNGWATEDATDVQDMGDFDFAANLSKFDKRQIFDDLRKDDNTADDERLVSFNRKAKPGTNGGKNLHFTENVLDMPDTWRSEAGETEDDVHHYSSGKGSKRASSRKPIPSRKPSTLPILDRTDSPRPLHRVATSPMNGSVTGSRASFRLSNNKPCHCVSPLQMLEIEQLCTSELGLTEDMLSENAARSIAEAVLRSAKDVRNVVFLVGNHKSGARAIAAARHLRNRRLRVTVVVLGGERDELLQEIVRKQLNTYTKGQGYVDRWDEFKAKLEAGGPSPDIIVDAILAIHVTFDELRTDDAAVCFEMIRWASRNGIVISIDVPSGLSAQSGLYTEVEGQMLVMNTTQVIALGAPKTGLLHATALDGAEASWAVVAADIGISTAAWQKHGSRRRHGIEFGNDWVVPLKFVAG